jgi:hypothetical protein
MLNADRAIALLALQSRFEGQEKVLVYNAAGRRIAVQVITRRRVIDLVWDVTFDDGYDVEGIDPLHLAGLDEVIDHVEAMVNQTLTFFEEALDVEPRRWNDHASQEEIAVLKDILLDRGEDERLLRKVSGRDFYIVANNGSEDAVVAGPYASEDKATAALAPAKDKVRELDKLADTYAYSIDLCRPSRPAHFGVI